MMHIQRPTILATLLALTAGTARAQDPAPDKKKSPSPDATQSRQKDAGTPSGTETDAAGQEPGKDDPDEAPEITFDDLWPSEENPEAQAQEEIAELFGKVERRLRLIDSMLLDASAGDTSRLAELSGSGIDDLLEDVPEKPEKQQSSESKCDGLAGSLGQSATQGRQAIDEINQIIEIAQSMPSNCPSGAPKEGEKPGGSPLDKPQGSRDKSQSPEKPKENPGEQPGQKPKEPKDNKSSEEEGGNEPADRIPGAETEAPPQVSDQREQWGDLPVHVRDVFRAEGGPGMPAEYRDWIDAYYRRLNSRSAD